MMNFNDAMMDPRRAFYLQLGASLMGNLGNPSGALGQGVSNGFDAARGVMGDNQNRERQGKLDAQQAEYYALQNQLAQAQEARAQGGFDNKQADRAATQEATLAATQALLGGGIDPAAMTPDVRRQAAVEQELGDQLPEAYTRRYGVNAQSAFDAMSTGTSPDAVNLQFDPNYEIFASAQQKAADDAEIAMFQKKQSISLAGQRGLMDYEDSKRDEEPLPAPPGQLSPNAISGEIQDTYVRSLESLAQTKGVPVSKLNLVDKERAKQMATEMSYTTKDRASIPDALLGQYDAVMNRGNDAVVTATADNFERRYGTTAAVQYLVSVGYDQEQAEEMMGVRIAPPSSATMDPAGMDPAILRMMQ